jgi:hypothetical protein
MSTSVVSYVCRAFLIAECGPLDGSRVGGGGGGGGGSDFKCIVTADLVEVV